LILYSAAFKANGTFVHLCGVGVVKAIWFRCQVVVGRNSFLGREATYIRLRLRKLLIMVAYLAYTYEA
jgi:hypothetical protein